MQGLHLTADLYDCQCAVTFLIHTDTLADLCRQAIVKANLTLVAERFFAFPQINGQPGGITGALLLAESHLAVHTWPETGSVTLDVYVCNFSTNNSDKARQVLSLLVAAFSPQSAQYQTLRRGTPPGHPKAPPPSLPNGEAETPSEKKPPLLLEWINEQSAYGYRATQVLEATQTEHQFLEVFDTPQWGKVMRLDGCFMTSEKEEFFYHEALVHPAAIAHACPKNILIIGGGDGGAAKQLLKHPDVRRITIVELDQAVVRAAKQHFHSVHEGSLEDLRVQIIFQDGQAFVAEKQRQLKEQSSPINATEQENVLPEACSGRFDLVLLDLTDPGTPAESLYSQAFLENVKEILHPDGALVLHSGSPIFTPARSGALYRSLADLFRIVRPFGLYIPLYGAYWSFCIASQSLDPKSLNASELERRLRYRQIHNLRYYNSETHQALFAIPNYFEELIATDGPPAATNELTS